MFESAGMKELIARLDERPASPETRASVAYAIVALSKPNNILARDVLDQYAIGFKDAALAGKLQDEVSAARMALARAEQDAGLYHLAWGIFPSDIKLDGYLAEFYIHWAKEIGLHEDDVIKIFACHSL